MVSWRIASPLLLLVAASLAVPAVVFPGERDAIEDQLEKIRGREESRGFVENDGRFVPRAERHDGPFRFVAGHLQGSFPLTGDGSVVMGMGSLFSIQVHEATNRGRARVDGQTLVYDHEGEAKSIWTALPAQHGFEEWLLLSGKAGEVASWNVTGALLRQAGDAVEVYQDLMAIDRPPARIVVRAAFALGESGARIGARLVARGSEIVLVLDEAAAHERRVLVDPSWSGNTINGDAFIPIGSPGLTFLYDIEDAEGPIALLPTGEVLSPRVVHGAVFQQFPATLPHPGLYEPTFGAWKITSSLPLNAEPPQAPSLTVLRDGTALMAGGSNGNVGGTTNACNLYDPNKGVWTATGPLATARWQHTATLLASGHVLVTGGVDGQSHAIAPAELFDPAAGTWSSAGNLLPKRTRHTVTALKSGTLLIVGGRDENGNALSDVQVYNEGSPSPFFPAHPVDARWGHTATLLRDGTVLVAGGFGTQPFGSAHPLTTCFLFDPTNPASPWKATGSMAAGRAWHSATLLPSGKVLVAGGLDPVGGFQHITSTEVYDPIAQTWSSAGTLNNGRFDQGATLLSDGNVFLVSGDVVNIGPGVPHTSELYEPTGIFLGTASPAARSGHTATLMPDGPHPISNLAPGPEPVVLVAGGEGAGNQALSDAALYDPRTGTVVPTGSLNVARTGHTATLLPNGNVVVIGGAKLAAGGVSYDLPSEVYDHAAGTWTAGAPLNVGRAAHTATALPDGKVLVCGGVNASGTLASVELYDPVGGTFTQLASMTHARAGHTATLFSAFTVLVAGGTDGVNILPTIEIFQVGPQNWVALPAGKGMSLPRAGHTATLLPNGQILFAGGLVTATAATNNCDLYDTDQFGVANNFLALSTPCYFHTASLLVDGKVLFVGGRGANGVIGDVQTFDPPTATFTIYPSVSPRAGTTMTLDPDGRVVVIGGTNGQQPLASSFLFDEGRHALAQAVPLVTSVTEVAAPDDLVVEGKFGFVQETTGGTATSSGTAYPLVMLQRGDNVGISFQPFTHFVPALPTGGSGVLTDPPFPGPATGWQWVRVIHDGVPSVAVPIYFK